MKALHFPIRLPVLAQIISFVVLLVLPSPDIVCAFHSVACLCLDQDIVQVLGAIRYSISPFSLVLCNLLRVFVSSIHSLPFCLVVLFLMF
jgi:hypothetical protein